MTTLQTTTRTGNARSFRILRRPSGDTSGRLLLTVGTQTDEYDYLTEPFEDGIAIHLFHESGDEDRIHTTIIAPSGNSCTCPGFTHRGRCKHVAAMSVLVSREAMSAGPVCSPAVRHPVCLRCRDTKVVRTANSVSVCELCRDF